MYPICHDTTDRGLTRLELFRYRVLGVGRGNVCSVWRVGWPDWNTGLVVLTRLLFIVRLCSDEGTGTQGKMRASEVL